MPITSMPNEQELILLISNGDRRAFTIFFDWYSKSLSSYILRLTESVTATEDIVQEVFIKIWMNRENLPTITNISNYLFILSKNHTLNHLRKRANYALRFDSLENDSAYSNYADTASNSFDEFDRLIDRAVDRLSTQQKKIYQLNKIDKLKHEEIAKQLNISVETVKKHSSLALKSIKDYVSSHLNELFTLALVVYYKLF